MRPTSENFSSPPNFYNSLTLQQKRAFHQIKEFITQNIGGDDIDLKTHKEIANLDRLQCKLLIDHFSSGLRGDALRLISSALGKEKADEEKITEDDVSKLIWLKSKLFIHSWMDVCRLFSAAATALRDARKNNSVTEDEFMVMVCQYAEDKLDLFSLFFYADSSMISAISDNIILDEGLFRKIIQNKFVDESILLKIIPRFKVQALFDDIPDVMKTNRVQLAIEKRLEFIKKKEALLFFICAILPESTKRRGGEIFKGRKEDIERIHFYHRILSVDSEKDLFFLVSHELLRLKDMAYEEAKRYRKNLIEFFKENSPEFDFSEIKNRVMSAIRLAMDYTVFISNNFITEISNIEWNDVLFDDKDSSSYKLDDPSSEDYFFHYFQNLILSNDHHDFSAILVELNFVLESHVEFSQEIRARLLKMKEIIESLPIRSVLLQQLLNTDIVIIFDLIHSADSLEMLYEILKNESYDFINSSPAVEKILDEIYGYYLIERELRKAEISFEL